MWWAVRTTLCRALLLPTVLFPNQAVMQPVRMLSTVQEKKDLRMLGLIPNFLSRLRKKRHWCAFFSTASVWADHVRYSVMLMPRNLKLFTRSTGVLSMGMGVCSLLSPEIHHQLLGLVDVEWEVVLLTPFSQGTHILSVGRLIVVSDQAYHRCVISKFADDVGAVCGCTVMCVQGVQEWAEDTALQRTSVDDQGRWGVVAHSDHLTSACQEIQDPAAQRSVQSQSLELRNQCGRHYGVKCWTIIHEQHSHIGVLIFQVVESSVQGEGNSIVCGTVAAICKL